jgi:plasmid stability protein
MTTNIIVRNVPKALHRKLKIRATSCGLTIGEYVKRLIVADLAKPTLAEMAERLRKRPPIETSRSAAELIREDRDGR